MEGYTKTIYSGDIIEIYHYERKPRITGRNHAVRKKASTSGHSRPKQRRYDNVRRVRKGFIRLVRANTNPDSPPALLTLTTSANLSIQEAGPRFNQFIKRAQKIYGSSFRYIAVPEFQERGAIHYHALVWGINPEHVAKERGTRFLQALWRTGFLDCTSTDGSPKLAGYLAKYMQKAMHDERLCGKKAYYTSRNVSRPLYYSHALISQYAPEIFGRKSVLITERKFDTEWLGECRYQALRLEGSEIPIDIAQA